MPSGTGRIIGDIQSFVSRHGEDYRNWYIGITADPLTRLLEEHKIDVNVDQWLCAEAFSNKEANLVLQRFINEFGMTGSCDVDDKGCFIYAYRMGDHTQP